MSGVGANCRAFPVPRAMDTVPTSHPRELKDITGASAYIVPSSQVGARAQLVCPSGRIDYGSRHAANAA